MYDKFEIAMQMTNDEVPEGRLYGSTPAFPSNVTLPEAWMLGSSGNSAVATAQLGAGYSFAQFFNGDLSKEILDLYKKRFVPSALMEEPDINVSYMVTTADTKEEAEYEALPYDISRLQLQTGRISQTMTPEAAQNHPLSELDKMRIEDERKLHLVGSSKEVADRLKEEQEVYGFDEAMICSIPHSQKKRLDVYKLLAKELL